MSKVKNQQLKDEVQGHYFIWQITSTNPWDCLLWWWGAQCSPLFLFTVSLHILIHCIALVLGFSSSYLKKC